MSYLFTQNGRLTTALAPVTATPLTIACWFWSQDVTTGYSLVALCPSSGGTGENRFNLIAAGNSLGDPIRYVVSRSNANIGTLDTSAGYQINTWSHACAVSSSNSSHTVYLNGANSRTSTQTATPSEAGLTALAIGSRYLNGWGAYANARIAEVGIWSAALTADEIKSLAAGASPALIRPQSLSFYAPLIRDLVDIRGGLAITNVLATVAEHPRIYT